MYLFYMYEFCLHVSVAHAYLAEARMLRFLELEFQKAVNSRVRASVIEG